MKTFTFLIISIISGAISGTILGIMNLAIVEPVLDKAIGNEIQNEVSEGNTIDEQEIQSYRIWQKTGQIAAGIVLGISLGALLGISFIFGKKILPGSNNQKKVMALVGIIWLVIFLIPMLKYPANPPTVGDPDTIYERQNLYVTFTMISGFIALGLAFLYERIDGRPLRKFVIISIIYSGMIGGVFITMPNNPDQIFAPIELVEEFRLASGFTMSIFWLVLGITFGSMWEKLKPQGAQITTI